MLKLTPYFLAVFAMGLIIGVYVPLRTNEETVEHFEITFEIPILVGHKFEDISLNELSSVYETVTGKPAEGKNLIGEIDGLKFKFAPKPRLDRNGKPRITLCMRFRKTATNKNLPEIQQQLQQINNALRANHPELQTDLATFEANPLSGQ